MIILLSPAKTLNFNPIETGLQASSVRFQEEPVQLVNKLKRMSNKGMRELMSISKDLAQLNKDRYESFDIETIDNEGKEALLAFNGGVYQGLDAETLDRNGLEYAQDHVRILSGLYGLLRPLDRMHEYRLEMGTKLPIRRKKNLYEFWGDKITTILQEDLDQTGSDVIVNCASQEYFKAVNASKIKAKIIDIQFKEMHKGELKFISFNAKKARGLMTRYAIDHSITDAEDLKAFNYEDYALNSDLSSENEWFFTM